MPKQPFRVVTRSTTTMTEHETGSSKVIRSKQQPNFGFPKSWNVEVECESWKIDKVAETLTK